MMAEKHYRIDDIAKVLRKPSGRTDHYAGRSHRHRADDHEVEAKPNPERRR